MNEIAKFPSVERAERIEPVGRRAEPVARPQREASRGRGAWRFGLVATALLAGGLGYGGWRDYQQRQEVAATAQQQHDFVPRVIVGQVRASGDSINVTLPGTTFAF